MRWQRGWVETEGKRGSKVYVGRYRASDGRKPKVKLGFVSEIALTEARSKLEAIVRELGSRPTSSLILTFDDYWTQHYVPRHRVRWGEPTEAGYKSYVRAYLKPAFGKLRVTDVTAQLVTAFFEKMRHSYSRSVVTKCWTLLHSILEDAVDDDFLTKNPMRRVEHPKTALPSKPVLSTDLLPGVMTAAQDDPFKSALLHVGAFCAMRTAEVLGLRWSAFCGDHFLIRDSAWKGKLLEDATKTGERSVYIPPATRAALLRWRKVSHYTGADDLVFCSKTGKTPMSANNVRNRILVPISEKLGLTVPLTFQVLRRSHATRNQASPKDVQGHLVHASITTTLGIYAQTVPASVKAMVEADETAVLGGKFAPISEVAPEMPSESVSLMGASA
jgi:integrase